MSFDKSDMDDDYANMQQRINELESLLDRMQLSRLEGGLNTIALEVAQQVEDLFAQHHEGGRGQRLARVQVTIREAMRANLTGKVKWDVDVRNISEVQKSS